MEQALEIWKQEGLPELKLKTPWYGYALGMWTAEDDAQAEKVVQGEYFESNKIKGL
jgi:4-hydroxy-3-polyprenylbenzoate decarboxylase